MVFEVNNYSIKRFAAESTQNAEKSINIGDLIVVINCRWHLSTFVGPPRPTSTHDWVRRCQIRNLRDGKTSWQRILSGPQKRRRFLHQMIRHNYNFKLMIKKHGF
jgi:hypothetical protein